MDEDHPDGEDVNREDDRQRTGDIDSALIHILGACGCGRSALLLRLRLVEKAGVEGLADGLAASGDSFVFHRGWRVEFQ